ncbi:MAG: sulfotransferase [Pseudomonadota bacterium]
MTTRDDDIQAPVSAHPEAPVQTAVIVTGMHRSGTSAVAGELAQAGMPVGDNLIAPSKDNAKGFFEDRRIVQIADGFLHRLGSAWSDPAALPVGYADSVPGRDAAAELSNHFSETLTGQTRYLLKDPRACRMTPVISQALENCGWRARYVAVVRNPAHVATSVWNRNQLPRLHALQIWTRYYVDLIERTDPRDITWVDFEAWSRAPAEESGALLRALNLPSDDRPAGPFFEKALVHADGAADVESPQEQLARAIYRDFQRGGVLRLADLHQLYHALGGNNAACERRHYGINMSILNTVVAELQAERAQRASTAPDAMLRRRNLRRTQAQRPKRPLRQLRRRIKR